MTFMRTYSYGPDEFGVPDDLKPGVSKQELATPDIAFPEPSNGIYLDLAQFPRC